MRQEEGEESVKQDLTLDEENGKRNRGNEERF